MKFIEKEILILRKKLLRWEKSYYVDNKSIVSDEKYDLVLKKLIFLEKKRKDLICSNSPTQKVGGYAQYIFNTVHHVIPMLSIKNIFKESEFINFSNRIEKKIHCNYIPYCCELKIDGIAISLIYKSGELIQASTRGDGKIGENVTSNVKFIQSIPKFLKNSECLPHLLEIRGEIFISKSNFFAINKMLKNMGKNTFSNPRNAASGSIRQKNPDINFIKKLNFFCYGNGIVQGGKLSKSHFIRLKQYASFGIPINEYVKICFNKREVINFYKEIYKIREKLKFHIDGIVIKVDSTSLREKIGTTSKFPLWEIAYKFPAKEKITEIYDIEFQVGKTGIITPIAKFKPVSILGITISKASLYNCKEIEKMKLMIGDTILVCLSGDIIPKIIKVKQQNINIKKQKYIRIPKFCPSCKSELVKEKSLLYCKNGTSCIAQRRELLKHFVSRSALNILGIGKKIINQLVDLGLVKYPSDLFRLEKKDFMKLNGVGKKLAENLINNLEHSKLTTFSRFIYSLGIRDVGKTAAESLSKNCNTINDLISYDLQSLIRIKNIGEKTAINIKKFFSNQSNINLIKELTSTEIGIYWK